MAFIINDGNDDDSSSSSSSSTPTKLDNEPACQPVGFRSFIQTNEISLGISNHGYIFIVAQPNQIDYHI